jgi:hypothetical protein
MSIPRKGSRRIIINGCTYLWYIRHKVDHWALICGHSLVVGIERIDPPSGRTLLFYADNGSHYYGTVITPRIVEVAILHSLKTGWKPHLPGSAFECWMSKIDWPTFGTCPDGYYEEWCERNARRARRASAASA